MKKTAFPDIKIEPTILDKLLEGAALASVIVLVLLPIYYWGSLPDVMPKHFNALGEPDAYGSKSNIWLLPAVGLFTYLLMTFVGKDPKNFNYPTKITPENAESKYRNAVMMLRWLKASILLLFVYMVFMEIQVGLGHSTGMGRYFIVFFIAAITAPILYFGFIKR